MILGILFANLPIDSGSRSYLGFLSGRACTFASKLPAIHSLSLIFDLGQLA